MEFMSDRFLDLLRDKEARSAFAGAHLGPNIAAQIRANRETRDWLQEDLGQRTGMKQTQISRLENPNYENFTLNTLRRLAEAFDVALVVRFVPFGDFADYLSTLSVESLSAPGFHEDMKTRALRGLEGQRADSAKLPARQNNGMPVQGFVQMNRARTVDFQGSKDLRQGETHRAA